MSDAAATVEEMIPSGDLPREEESIPDRLFPEVDLDNVEWSCSVERIDPPMHTFQRIGRIHVLGQVLKIVNDEHRLTKEYIGKQCGGHRYRLNLYVPSRKKRGPYKHDKITCPGDPAFPSPEYIQRQVAAGKIDENVLHIAGQGIGGHVGGNGAGLPVSTAESNLASKVVTSAESRADKLQAENAKLQTELREKAAKEAEVTARLIALEEQLETQKERRAIEPQIQKNANEHEIGMLGIVQSANAAQLQAVREAADARLAALEKQLSKREDSAEKTAEAATAPMRQFMEDQGRRHTQALEASDKRHGQETAASDSRHQQMMEMLTKSNDNALKLVQASSKAGEALQQQRMDDYREELKMLRSEKGKGLKEQITEIVAIVTAVKELGVLGGGGGDEGKSDMVDKLVEGLSDAAPHLPGIIHATLGGVRSLITGQPIQHMGGYTAQIAGGPPGQPGQPGAPPAEPEKTPAEQAAAEAAAETERQNQELAQDVEHILDALVEGLKRNTSARDTANYILTKHERAAMQLAAVPEMDKLVASAQQRRPPLASVSGDKYVREVMESVKALIN